MVTHSVLKYRRTCESFGAKAKYVYSVSHQCSRLRIPCTPESIACTIYAPHRAKKGAQCQTLERLRYIYHEMVQHRAEPRVLTIFITFTPQMYDFKRNLIHYWFDLLCTVSVVCVVRFVCCWCVCLCQPYRRVWCPHMVRVYGTINITLLPSARPIIFVAVVPVHTTPHPYFSSAFVCTCSLVNLHTWLPSTALSSPSPPPPSHHPVATSIVARISV